MKLIQLLERLLFPPKCVLCRKLLADSELDLCTACRETAPEFSHGDRRIPYLAKWTSLWYYKDKVRLSLHRYKFRSCRSYAGAYGRLLAMKLLQEDISFDILTWVPVSARRKRSRGYDQCAYLAAAVAKELGVEAVPTLIKHRHNPAQSGIREASVRKANVLGAYRILDPAAIAGKRILLLDDILTTGATASECARTLLTANAKEVFCAAIAAAPPHHK